MAWFYPMTVNHSSWFLNLIKSISSCNWHPLVCNLLFHEFCMHNSRKNLIQILCHP
jgi:hypothetical protein